MKTGFSTILSVLLVLVCKSQPFFTYTIAGNGTSGFSGDGGTAYLAQLSYPYAVALDGSGNVYIGEDWNDRVRLVNTFNVINTDAGTGVTGFSGDGGASTSARLNFPAGIAAGASAYYIADWTNNRIRKVSSGTITTIAGTGSCGYSGNGGQATLASMCTVSGIAIDGAGNLFVTEYNNHVLRKISPSGIITLVAGTGVMGYSGDGGQATSAQLAYPHGVTLDAAGNIYISDGGNSCIRKVSPSGIITTIAGNGTQGNSGNGGQAASAQLNTPQGVCISNNTGNIYISDNANNCIREVNALGIINYITYVGVPIGIAINSGDSIYVCDALNHNVLAIYCPPPSLNVASSSPVICAGQSATLSANGPLSFWWTGGSNSSSIVVSPTVTTTYTVVGRDNGCSATRVITQTVSPPPALTINTSDSILCVGQTATLSVTGTANSYSWSPGGTGTSVVISPTITTSYSVTGTYTFGCQPQMAAFTQSVSTCTGMESITHENFGISIFPNPANDKIFLKNKKADAIELNASITDFLGREIKRENIFIQMNEASAIDISKLPGGIYFLRIESQDMKVYGKIVKE